ncbi:hypothetical protein [uncultured Citricoccus sp.]|uniref:hypothetical protein n=1 Tax=uncultured Citricoccus sp. TaxID=614031 RepID=UPI00260EA0AF|nr:hypothetical protein [uncultured Citricoccus sp.]
MGADGIWQWIFGGLAATVLISGLAQLMQGAMLGWAAVIAAVLLLLGVLVWRRWPTRYRWGRFMRVCGVYIGFIWLIALMLEVLGWDGEFSWAAWGAGIGVATLTVWGADPGARSAGNGTGAETGQDSARQTTES